MEISLERTPCCFALGSSNILAVGNMDGCLELNTYDPDPERQDFTEHWRFRTKSSIRAITFSEDGSTIYGIGRNKSLCSYDTETGKRTRCIVKSHEARPTTICLLPSTARKNQQFATGDENGYVHTWDFRSENPLICQWSDQTGDINALAMDSNHNLLSASADNTLAAYEVRKCKLRLKSEEMGSELLSICATEKFVYVGTQEGYVEIFKNGEYGNILERIESGFDMNVSQIIELRTGLLLTSSETSNEIRALNVMPNKKLGIAAKHGGAESSVDQIGITPDCSWLLSMDLFSKSLKFWPFEEITAKFPILRADSIKKKKINGGFFSDLVDEKYLKSLEKRKKRKDSDSDDDDKEDAEQDSESDNDDSDDINDEEMGSESDVDDEEEDSEDPDDEMTD
ncbi:hypothetical protein WR25_13320 [Diploscapter pachys]|uniref:Uncharacterized protein n=1 Tax=Diploscapter pachys TaxID=2018661 RepID=A0A2A2LBU0_9BILA|nr:hypothetical protein WR25_13320 [Diploscapter pachys]